MMFQYWEQLRRSTWFKLAVTAGISYILYLLSSFLLPILLAVGLAFALYPLVGIIEQIRMAHGMIRFSRVMAIALAIMAFIACIGMIITYLILPLFGQLNDFVVLLPQWAQQSNFHSLETMLNDPSKIPMLPSNYEMLFNDLITWAMGMVGSLTRNLLRSSLDIVSNLIGMIIVPFLAFYFMKDWRDLRQMGIDLFNADVRPQAAKVIDEIGQTISAYVRGLFKLSLISGFVISVGMTVLGINFPLVFGFWALLAEMVPVVGPLMGAVPAVFIAYGQEPRLAFYVALFYLVYYQMDSNFILPRIMGKKIDLHPVLIIGSLLIGAKLFGILGMVFAVPVAAVYRVLYKNLWHAGEKRSYPEGHA